MSNNPTPGPWSYQMNGNHARIYLHGLGQADSVEGGDSLQGYCGEANARLIAAATDLLEELVDRYHDTKCGCEHPACRRCQADARTLAVIRKAKGESDE